MRWKEGIYSVLYFFEEKISLNLFFVFYLNSRIPIKKSNKRVIISHEGSLLINEVRINDSANYTCVAENLAGRRSSDPAMLSVTSNLTLTKSNLHYFLLNYRK